MLSLLFPTATHAFAFLSRQRFQPEKGTELLHGLARTPPLTGITCQPQNNPRPRRGCVSHLLQTPRSYSVVSAADLPGSGSARHARKRPDKDQCWVYLLTETTHQEQSITSLLLVSFLTPAANTITESRLKCLIAFCHDHQVYQLFSHVIMNKRTSFCYVTI